MQVHSSKRTLTFITLDHQVGCGHKKISPALVKKGCIKSDTLLNTKLLNTKLPRAQSFAITAMMMSTFSDASLSLVDIISKASSCATLGVRSRDANFMKSVARLNHLKGPPLLQCAVESCLDKASPYFFDLPTSFKRTQQWPSSKSIRGSSP